MTLTRKQVEQLIRSEVEPHEISNSTLKSLLTLALERMDMEQVFDRILKQVVISQASEAEKPEAKYIPTVAWLGFMHIKDAINEHRSPNTKGRDMTQDVEAVAKAMMVTMFVRKYT